MYMQSNNYLKKSVPVPQVLTRFADFSILVLISITFPVSLAAYQMTTLMSERYRKQYLFNIYFA